VLCPVGGMNTMEMAYKAPKISVPQAIARGVGELKIPVTSKKIKTVTNPILPAPRTCP